MAGQSTNKTTKKARRPPGCTKWYDTFLEALSLCGNITDACKAGKISRAAAYSRRKTDDAFAGRWNRAVDTAIDSLEREAWRRAVDGVEESIYAKGKLVKLVRKYSDVLLIFLLKANRPAKFRDRHEGAVTADQNITIIMPPTKTPIGKKKEDEDAATV